MCKERKFALGPVGLLCVVGTVAMLPVPQALVPEALVPEARAADECGGSSAFVARYTAHSTSTSYSAGDFVTTGTGANLKIWEAGSAVSGTTAAPTTAAPAGWEDVTTQYAANKVVCDSSDTLSSTTDISYDDADLQIEFDRSGVTVNSITHTGTGGEIYLKAGAVSRAAASGANRGVRLVSGGNTELFRVTMDSGTSITNLDGTSDSHAIDVGTRAAGDVELNIAGSTTAAAREGTSGAGNAAIHTYSRGGSIDINITGGTHTTGGGGRNGAAIIASLWQPSSDSAVGTGSIDIDVSGASTVLTAPDGARAVIRTFARAGTNSVTIGAGSTICAGTYTPSTSTCSSSQVAQNAVELGRQFEGTGTTTFTNSGNVYGRVHFTRAVTTTATNSGNIYGRLWVEGTTVTVTLNAGSTITNARGASVNHALAAIGGTGGVDLDIAGSTTAAARSDTGNGNAAINAISPGGSIDIDITGGTHRAGGGGSSGVAVAASITQTSLVQSVGTGSVDIDISGANTVLTAPGVDEAVVYAAGRTGSVSVGVGTGSTVCAGTYSAGACTGYGGRSAVLLTRQFPETGTSTFTNAGNIYGSVSFRRAATSTATNSGNIYGSLVIQGTALAVTLNAGSAVTNDQTASGNHALNIRGGANGLDVDIAGSTSAAARSDSGRGNAAIFAAIRVGSIDIDITGGTHRAGGGGRYSAAVHASLWQPSADTAVGTGSVEVDISGANTVLTAPGIDAPVVHPYARAGANSVTIGTGSMICAGTYSSGACTGYSGRTSVRLGRQFAAGTSTLTNAGNVYGNVLFSRASTSAFTNSGNVYGSLTIQNAASSTIMNQAGAQLVGRFTSGEGASTFTNRGTWVMTGNSDFGAGTDTFTNTGTGTLAIQISGTSGSSMGNLEIFTLQAAGAGESGGIIDFRVDLDPLPTFSLLNINAATPTLTGVVRLTPTGGSSIPTVGSMALFMGTKITSTTDVSSLGLDTAITTASSGASLEAAEGFVILTIGSHCGALSARTAVAPGQATRSLVCDSADALTAATDVTERRDRVAISYSGSGTPIRSIQSRGVSGEIHIESGSVVHPDDETDVPANALLLGAQGDRDDPDLTALIKVALDATAAEGTLTQAQVFARNRAVVLTTASDTLVRNEDPTGGLAAIPSGHAILVNAWGGHINMNIAGNTYAHYAAIRAITGLAGNTRINIQGGTHRVVQGGSVIYVWTPQFVFAGALDEGRPSGQVDIDIGSGSRLSLERRDEIPGERPTVVRTAVIIVDAEWSYSSTSAPSQRDDLLHTIDIATDAVVCRGVLTAGVCRPKEGGLAIALGATGTRAQSDGAEPIFQITNQGAIYGDIYTRWNTRGVELVNWGTIVGNYLSGEACGRWTGGAVRDFGVGCVDGPDVVVNEVGALWIMTQHHDAVDAAVGLRGSDFGAGGGDSFINRGTLVLKYTGTPINLKNLELFTQAASGTLLVEVDPRRFEPDGPDADERLEILDPELPSADEPILDFGSAAGVVQGALQVILINTEGLHGEVSQEDLDELIRNLDDAVIDVLGAGHRLTLTNLRLLGDHLAHDESSGVVTFDLSMTPMAYPTFTAAAVSRAQDLIVAHTYDSLTQAIWLASYSLLNTMATSECAVKDAFSQTSATISVKNRRCSWIALGGRYSSHKRGTIGLKETQEFVFSLNTGLQVPLGGSGWGLSATAVYEYSDMDVGREVRRDATGREIGRAKSESHRLLLGLLASTVADDKPWNVFIGLTAQGGLYEVNRPEEVGTFSGEPTMFMGGVHGGVEYVLSGRGKLLGGWAVVPRLRVDALALGAESFTESSPRRDTPGVTLDEIEAEFLVSGTPSVEVRYAGRAGDNEIQSWLSMGLLAFATDPELNYTLSRGRSSRTLGGTMERFLLEASVGVNLVRMGGTEFSFFLDGLLGYDTIVGAATLKAKYAF